jgi:hypothetical protein
VTDKVYVIGSPGSRIVKIGFSKAPLKRLWSLQVGSPVPLALLATFEGGRDLESALHRYFGTCWKRGEWFELGDAPVAEVRAAVALSAKGLLSGRNFRLAAQRTTEKSRRAAGHDDRFLPLARGRANALLTKLGVFTPGRINAENPAINQCQEDRACVDCRAGRPAFLADPDFVIHGTSWDAVRWDARFQPLGRTGTPTA